MSAAEGRAWRACTLFILGVAMAASPAALPCSAQSISSGTVVGTVTDQSGAAVVGAMVEIHNALTGYRQTTTCDTSGSFQFNNVPLNNYRLTATSSGFSPATQDITVRSSVPQTVKLALAVAGVQESVTVEATANVIENEPGAHTDVDPARLVKLPITTPGSGISDAITITAPGVVTDSNGFYHPLGDHAQTSFQIDGQPVNDQMSKVFSTQLPTNALQSMQLTTGFPGAEYGEKTSMVVNASTRSGLGQRTFGSLAAGYGSFGTTQQEGTLGFGDSKFGFFLTANGSRSGRFLDTPEFLPIHDIGNSGSLFNRLDYQADSNNIFHLDLFAARNWFQIPNTFDQLNQDQRQRVLTYNIAPGYQHIFNPHTLLTVNAWLRRDQVNYYPSADRLNDTPATVDQQRFLLNWGWKSDVAYSHGVHNIKFGAQVMQTRLAEHFGLGITNPADPAFANLEPSSLAALDLTSGGHIARFNDTGNINEYAVYVTDAITWRQFTFSPGLRVTRYDGLSEATGVQPRFGLSYLIKRTGTVLRASYARTLETPANENLLLSSSTGSGGLTDLLSLSGEKAVPLQPGRRNQFNVGFQQTFGRFVQIDADYFWKFTRNAAEFDVLFNTPITFPIMWRKDKLDGFGIRVSTLNLKGFQVNTAMGRGRLRYFGPEVGGLFFQGVSAETPVFRTDSDDALYQTTTVHYQWRKTGPWAAFMWRYDNGQVSEGSTLEDILGFTADQQAAMGFLCGRDFATPTHKIVSCSLPFPQWGATRVQVPAPGTFDPDRNPARVASRHLFDIAVGTDNLLRTSERKRVTLQFTVANLTNKVALYNFLSTFGGTHFVAPRSYQAKVGFVF
ncbi:MAG: carboxypeptidase regulatory-like domain-containing protein [Terriglobales bacterium]